MLFKRYAWPIIFSLCLILFTVYFMLDTFVIPKSLVTVPEDSNIEAVNEIEKPKNVIIEDNLYKDENVTITLKEYREYNSNIYVAEIELLEPLLLKSAFAKSTYGHNIKENTSEIAKANDAIFAVNGDFYGTRKSRYVIRNGIHYRDIGANGYEDLVVYKNGSYSTIIENTVTGPALVENGANHLWSFGPTLVRDGVVSVSEDDTTGIAIKNPRTAIGFADPSHLYFVVADGRTRISEGLTFFELASFMKKIGAVSLSYNLDGGGSSTMYFNGRIINNPSANGSDIVERSVSDIVYIGY